jgi:hypothetical protein
VQRVEALKIVLELGVGGFNELGQRCPREMAILVVARFGSRAIPREQLPAGLVGDRAAQTTEDLAEGIAVVTLNVSEVRLQVSQRPDHLEIAVRFGLQPKARPHPAIARGAQLLCLHGG